MSPSVPHGAPVCVCKASRQMAACLWLCLSHTVCRVTLCAEPHCVPLILVHACALGLCWGKGMEEVCNSDAETQTGQEAAFFSPSFPFSSLLHPCSPLSLDSVFPPLAPRPPPPLGWERRRLWTGRVEATFPAGWLAGEQAGHSLGLCLMLGSHGNAKRRAETPWLPRPVSLRGQWFLAQDVVAGKPNYSGMLCSNVLLLCSTHLRLGTPCTCLEDWCTPMLPYNLNTLSLSPPHWAPCPSLGSSGFSQNPVTFPGVQY